MKLIVIKSCKKCPHTEFTMIRGLHCIITKKEFNMDNYPKIPKDCPLENYRDPKIQYQD
jgi:hypothetical protein